MPNGRQENYDLFKYKCDELGIGLLALLVYLAFKDFLSSSKNPL